MSKSIECELNEAMFSMYTAIDTSVVESLFVYSIAYLTSFPTHCKALVLEAYNDRTALVCRRRELPEGD